MCKRVEMPSVCVCLCLQPLLILGHPSLKYTVAFSNNAVWNVFEVAHHVGACVCCVDTYISMHPSHPLLSAGSHLSATDLPTSGQCMFSVRMCVPVCPEEVATHENKAQEWAACQHQPMFPVWPLDLPHIKWRDGMMRVGMKAVSMYDVVGWKRESNTFKTELTTLPPNSMLVLTRGVTFKKKQV